MGLIVALLVIVFLAYILFKQNKPDNRKVNFNANSLIFNILTIIVICLAVVQSPLFYYYTFGLFSLFAIVPYLFISLILTGILLIPMIKRKKVSTFQKYGVTIAIMIGTLTLFFGSDLIEKIDWELRLNERNLIIE